MVDYFGYGKYYSTRKAEYEDYIVIKLSDIMSKIIPFFQENVIEGVKFKDYNAICEVANLIKESKI